jgi:3-oxoacyl-[acyl-carrier protein] reductase
MNIIITGASSGIGYELAKSFAASGNHKIVAIARNADKLKGLKHACIRENVEAHLYPLPFDLSLSESYNDNLIPQIKQLIPDVDIIINNAGYLVNKSFQSISQKDMEQMISVNFFAPALLIQSLLPIIKPGGHVVSISSMGGFQGSTKFAGLSIYSATKAAIASLTECLAEELKDSKISFNCLALGAVNTEMLAAAFPNYIAPVSAGEMAKFIANFSLTGNKYFNGKVIPVSLSTP